MEYEQIELTALEHVVGRNRSGKPHVLLFTREYRRTSMGPVIAEVTIVTREGWRVTYHRVQLENGVVNFHSKKPFRPLILLTTHSVGKVAMLFFLFVGVLSALGVGSLTPPLAMPALVAGSSIGLHWVFVERFRKNVRDRSLRRLAILHDVFVLTAFVAASSVMVTAYLLPVLSVEARVLGLISLAWALFHASWLSSLTDRFFIRASRS